MSVTRILLADDHDVVRHGLRAVLEATGDFTVVGECADGLEVSGLVDRLRPSVLIVDLMMPGLSGLEVIRQVHERFPQTRIVVLSMHASEPYVMEALRNGASGYVLKESSAADLIQAVREVMAGRHYLSQPLSNRAIQAYAERAQSAAPLDSYETLTAREREVLHLAAEGYSSTEMAAKLGISPRTAETHRAHLMRKLNLRNQSELIRYALRRGLLPPEA
jgi:two-component system response regulator NreC